MRKSWSNNEVAKLKTLYGTGYTLDEIARILGRTKNSINNKLRRIGMAKRFKERLWSKEDDKLLKELYPVLPVNEVAKRLNRTVASVYNRAIRFGIRKVFIWKKDGRDAVRWSEEEEKILTKNSIFSASELAQILGRNEDAVRAKLRHLKLVRGNKKANFMGRKGERLIKKELEMDWEIIKLGNYHTPFDFVIKKGNETLYVNAKYGKKVAISPANIRNLLNLGNSAIIYMTPEKDMYMFRIERMKGVKKIEG